MSKFNVKDLNCFKQVAEVIGEARAKVELYKVMNCGGDLLCNGAFDLKDGDLIDAFHWDVTPQGEDFWDKVYLGTCPYEGGL